MYFIRTLVHLGLILLVGFFARDAGIHGAHQWHVTWLSVIGIFITVSHFANLNFLSGILKEWETTTEIFKSAFVVKNEIIDEYIKQFGDIDVSHIVDKNPEVWENLKKELDNG